MANHVVDQHMVEVDEIPDYPQQLSLAYDRRCNYHCTCCISRCDDRMDSVVQEKIEGVEFLLETNGSLFNEKTKKGLKI